VLFAASIHFFVDSVVGALYKLRIQLTHSS
jgi:hypothetical protein